MSKEVEYRRFAAEAFELATRTDNQTDKARLIDMADAWRDLAERSRAPRSDWRTTDHPLVQETFRRYRS
jgi:hypothetical protein